MTKVIAGIGANMMGYWLNKDKTTSVAKVHRDDSKYKRCRPREKQEQDGGWEHIISVPEEVVFNDTLLRIVPCVLCKPWSP